MEARPPAAGFFACKEPREETTRASALDPGPRGGAVQVTCKTCKRSGLGSVWRLRRIGLPPLRHMTRPDLKVVAVQQVPKKPHVLPCPIQRLAFVGAIHESPAIVRLFRLRCYNNACILCTNFAYGPPPRRGGSFCWNNNIHSPSAVVYSDHKTRKTGGIRQ